VIRGIGDDDRPCAHERRSRSSGAAATTSRPPRRRSPAQRSTHSPDLVVDAWEELSAALEQAAEKNAGAGAAKRLGAIGLAYRAWATAQPHRYRLAVQTPLGSGELAPERVIPAAQRGMAVILDAIEDLPAARKPKLEPPADLRAELDAWTERVGGPQVAPRTTSGSEGA
jgi:hypothetical protein